MKMPTHLNRRRIVPILLCLIPLLLAGALPARAGMARLDPACQELVQDGGFEGGTAWTLNPSAVSAAYVQQPVHAGQFAMRMGIVEEFNREAYSSLQQQVTLPAAAQSITLRFNVYPLSEPSAGDDEQYLALLDPATGTRIAKPWRTQSDGRAWSEEVIDLSQYRGRSLVLYFNVYNDGSGGRTAMYIDDVSLQVCTAPTPTPTPTITPTPTATSAATNTPTATPIVPTPTPSATATTPAGPCQLSCLPNGDFEGYGTWQLGTAPLYPTYVSGQGLHGSRAMRLGNDGLENVASYSSIRQNVVLPDWPATISLRFWYRPLSEGVDADDYQELLLLQPQSQEVEARLWRVTRDDRRWLQQLVDLSVYRGRSVSLYFNVNNDGAGGRTAMYLDDVCLELCGDVPQQQAPEARPTVQHLTPTPTRSQRTATPTRRYRTPTPTSPRPAAQAATRTPTTTATSAAPQSTAPPTAMPSATSTASSERRQATATPTTVPSSTPTSRVESVMPLTGVPALPSAFAGWGPLEWVLATLAAIIVLIALWASVRVIARYWILPLLGRRNP